MPRITSTWQRHTAHSCQTDLVQIFTPNAARYRGRFGWVLPAILILALLIYWRFDQPMLVYLAEMIILLVVIAAYILLYFRNVRFTAEPRSLTIRTTFGMSHRVAEHHLAKAILIENYITSKAQNATAVPRLFLLDDEGSAVLRWSGQVWTENQMRELVTALDMELTEIPGRLGSGDIHRRYPRALGMWESHPIAVAITLIAALVVLSITVVSGILSSH
jgi:hypothetical protein